MSGRFADGPRMLEYQRPLFIPHLNARDVHAAGFYRVVFLRVPLRIGHPLERCRAYFALAADPYHPGHKRPLGR